MATKLKIISDREKGDRVRTLVKRYGVKSNAISNIWNKRDSYKNKDYADGVVVSSFCNKRTNVTNNMEIEVNRWIDEEKRSGRTVAGHEICEKARVIHQILLAKKESEPGCSQNADIVEPIFKASSGWLHRFLKRRNRKVTTGNDNKSRHKTCLIFLLFLKNSILNLKTQFFTTT